MLHMPIFMKRKMEVVKRDKRKGKKEQMHRDNAWNIHKWFYVCLISNIWGIGEGKMKERKFI